MADEQDQSQALVKYEPQPLSIVERLELYSEVKKRELREALERRQVAEPISMTAILVSLAVSAATTAASMLITSVLTPRQRITEERGRRTGELVLNAELGILIPEVYFGMLDDGYGGSWVPAIVGWTSGIRPHVSTTTTQTGGGKFGGGGATTEVKEHTYDLDWLLIWANKGPYRVLKSKANADVIFDLYGEVSSYEGESASSYTSPYVIVAFESASGGNEVTLQNRASGNGGSVQWATVQSNGAATRQLTIYYRTSSNTVPIELTINGGTPQPITLAATNELYFGHTVPIALNNGANTVKIQNKSTTFNVGIDKIYCFPGHSTSTAGTGVFDPTAGGDPTYDPEEPPDPTTPFVLPLSRWEAAPDEESTGGQTGTMNQGGNAAFAIYPGNTTQLPDPTYEAAIDAEFGAGSTPAYRGRCYEVDSNFYLTRWGGVIPNRIALLEHETIKNLAQFSSFMCSRVAMPSADHNFSQLEAVTPRGLRIMGSRFEAREPMTSAAMVYDVIYCEQDGQLIGKPKYPFTSVATLTDKDFGWNDDEESSDGPITLIDVIEPSETDLPRRGDVKYVDLDRDGEPGLQGYGRQVTEGEDSFTLDLQWTLTREEAQALAQKEVFRRYIEKPCRYFLSWEHLWFNVGDVFIASLSDGFTYTILHAKDSGGLGVRECEGIILDEPLFDQSAVVDPYGYEQPVVPIPAMTIVLLLDVPLLRDGDETTNNGVGFYVVGTPRTNTAQTWGGYALNILRNNVPFEVARSNIPGTIGVIVSAVGLSTDTTVIDRVGVITVDLYGTTTTLESISEDDLLAGGNLAIMGDLVFQFATATMVGGFDNRWELSILLNGRKGTEAHVTDSFTDKRFVLINSAVQFVPMLLDDLNVEHEYQAVTSGQSLDDAATISFTWTGGSKQPYSHVGHKGTRDSEDDLLIEFRRRTRIGGGQRSYQAGATNEEEEIHKVQILDGSGNTTLANGRERILTIVPAQKVPLAAFLLSSRGSFLDVTHNIVNGNSESGAASFPSARSAQTIQQSENFIEGVMRTEVAGGGSTVFGIQQEGGHWKGLALDFGPIVDDDTLTGNLATFPYLVRQEPGGGAGPFYQLFSVYEYGERIVRASSNPGDPDYDPDFGWVQDVNDLALFRIRFNFIGSSVRIQKAHTAAVPFTTVATGTRSAVFPVFAVAGVWGPNSSVGGIMMTCYPFPKTIYSAGQQTEDGFTPGDPIQMETWQESKLVGPGPRTRVTL